jgi:hypothetical protein
MPVGKPVKNFASLSDQYLAKKIKKTNPLLKKLKSQKKTNKYAQYKGHPNEYAKEVLGINWWSKQTQIANLLEQNAKVLVRSSHLTGKSFFLSSYCTYVWNTEDVLLGSVFSPTFNQTKDVLFRQIRAFMKDSPDMVGTTAPILYNSTNPNKILKGISANDTHSLQGRHTSGMVLLVIDEACGINNEYYPPLFTIAHGGSGSRFVACYNPTDTSSVLTELEQQSDFNVISISGLEHPNVIYYDNNPDRDDNYVPIPGAITGPLFIELMRKWSSPIDEHNKKITDVRLPGTNDWVRPNSIGESRLLGRWPTVSFTTVWSPTLFDVITDLDLFIDTLNPPEMGIDVARMGDDSSVIAIKQDNTLFDMQEYNSLSITEFATIIENEVKKVASTFNTTTNNIPIKIDSTGLGAGTFDILDDKEDLNVIDINFSESAYEIEKYANIRAELWFSLKEQAEKGIISFNKVQDQYLKNKLRTEFITPYYRFNPKGKIIIESKEDTKKRARKGSPNLADAVNLAFYDQRNYSNISVSVTTKNNR